VLTRVAFSFADTPNKKNRLTLIAEPLEKGLVRGVRSYTRIDGCYAPDAG
jgi:hypothetical protein